MSGKPCFSRHRTGKMPVPLPVIFQTVATLKFSGELCKQQHAMGKLNLERFGPGKGTKQQD